MSCFIIIMNLAYLYQGTNLPSGFHSMTPAVIKSSLFNDTGMPSLHGHKRTNRSLKLKIQLFLFQPSVRKTHCGGRKHKENVCTYYQKWLEDQVQKLVDDTSMSQLKINKYNNQKVVVAKITVC